MNEKKQQTNLIYEEKKSMNRPQNCHTDTSKSSVNYKKCEKINFKLSFFFMQIHNLSK